MEDFGRKLDNGVLAIKSVKKDILTMVSLLEKQIKILERIADK